MLTQLTDKYQVILASNSSRRKELLKEIVPFFKTDAKSVEEIYPETLKGKQIAIYLSELKSAPFAPESNELIITSDTIVVLKNEVMGKPSSKEDAIKMLEKLSGKTHEVITGVTIKTKDKTISFSDSTQVEFYPLSSDEIYYYVEKYKPYDKAGSYGIQEWIGYIGIKKMNGDFYNVMGLPVHLLYRELKKFA